MHPGGDPDKIGIEFDHATELAVGHHGAFTLESPFGRVMEERPHAYQSDHQWISCDFVLRKNTLTFHASPYDRTKDLVIDPLRLWGTYFGGHGSWNNTWCTDLTVDRASNTVSFSGFQQQREYRRDTARIR